MAMRLAVPWLLLGLTIWLALTKGLWAEALRSTACFHSHTCFSSTIEEGIPCRTIASAWASKWDDTWSKITEADPRPEEIMWVFVVVSPWDLGCVSCDSEINTGTVYRWKDIMHIKTCWINMRGHHNLGRITKWKQEARQLGAPLWDFPNCASSMTLPPFDFLSLSLLYLSFIPPSSFCLSYLLCSFTSAFPYFPSCHER